MARGIRAIIYNGDEAYASALRALLLGVDGLQIAAEVDDAALVASATAQFPCDLVVAHIDPNPGEIIALLSQLPAANPDLPIFAISECSDGQVILTAMRAGIREYLTKPVDKRQLVEAIDRVVQQAASRVEPGAILAVMGSVGGSGATTVAVNLAVELAGLSGERVALVDLDYRFGQVATMLDLQPQFTIADLCDTPEQFDSQMLKQAMVEHASGVHVLARPNHFAQAELITGAHCASVLTALQDQYRYVVVDGPTRYDVGAKSVFDLASLHLMVLQLLVPSVRNVYRILEEMASNGYNLDRVRVVCNRASKESGYLEKEHVEATLNREIFFTVPDDWRTISASVNMGVPLAQSAPKARVRQAFSELAGRIHAPAEAAEEGPGGAKKGGVLSKLFSAP